MNLKKNKVIEEELKVKRTEFFRKLIKHDENWHNGETYKFENDKNEEDIRYSQFKTIIVEKDNKNCFIYDEIIKRKDKPILVLKLHNDKKKKS